MGEPQEDEGQQYEEYLTCGNRQQTQRNRD